MDRNTVKDFTFSVAGSSPTIDCSVYPGVGCHRHTVQIVRAPGVSVFTYRLFGSTKYVGENPVFPDDFVALGTEDVDYFVNPATYVYDTLVNCVVVKAVTLLGGTVSVRYLGSR